MDVQQFDSDGLASDEAFCLRCSTYVDPKKKKQKFFTSSKSMIDCLQETPSIPDLFSIYIQLELVREPLLLYKSYRPHFQGQINLHQIELFISRTRSCINTSIFSTFLYIGTWLSFAREEN